jgi:hypothetical protein
LTSSRISMSLKGGKLPEANCRQNELGAQKLRHQPLAKASYATGGQCPCQRPGRLRLSWRIGSLKFGTTRPPSPAKTITAISLPKCPFSFVVVKGVVATCFISPLSRHFQSPLAVVVILNCAGAKPTEFAVRSSIKITSFILPHPFMVVAVGQRLCPSHRY